MVRVVEGTNVGSADDGIGERVESGRVGVGRFGFLELLEQGVLLCQLGKDAREVVALLRGGLGAVRRVRVEGSVVAR